MEEKKQYTALTIDRAAFLLLRVKKAFKKKKLQRKEREKNAQLAAARIDQRASCAGLEGASRSCRKPPPPLLRSRTLPAIVVPGVNILQAQLGNYTQDVQQEQQTSSPFAPRVGILSRYHPTRLSFTKDQEPNPSLDVGRRKSAVSRLCGSGNYGPERKSDGTLLLRVPAPHVVAARAYRIQSPSGNTALYRLSKLLNQSSKNQVVLDDSNVTRRLSWERRDPIGSRMPRSASIDSMVEAVWSETVSADPTPITEKRPSLRPDRTLALVSPSVGRRMKGQRGVNALFAAVEHGHLDKAKTILESTDVDVNSLNADKLSPLDVAVLSNNRTMVKMLIGFGAKEGNQFSSSEKLGSHLTQLLGEAEMRLQEFGGFLDEPASTPLNTRASFSSIIGTAYPSASMTGCAGGDNEKQAIVWGRRVKTLKRLVLGFNQARPPDQPSVVALDITSCNAVSLRLQEPLTTDSSITTKFKVQWSTRPDFSPITGEKEIFDLTNSQCTIELTQGRRYYFRASSGNLRGYGTFVSSIPESVVPSTWRSVDNRELRFQGKLHQLEILMQDLRNIRPNSEILESTAPQRRTQRKKTTIKQLFSAASKFQKNLKRGIYLACILYYEDKVLVTNEDFLPVIEIDENFPSCIHSDHHWLMKVACAWDNTKSLKADMEKNASSAIHFRTKLLSAALQMQSALCLQDLGQLYYKPLKDSQGTVVISTVNYVKTPKTVSVLNSRWLPMNKVVKKCVMNEDNSITEILMGSIPEQINYHQVSSLKLGKGLYLAFLKMQSSVDLIQVVVPAKTPNMLPHCKIRDNPHVSAEEWEYLKRQHLPDIVDTSTEQQRTFLELVTSAAKRLFNYMDIPLENAITHRLYDTEIVDLTEEVSFIIICPSAEFSCLVPGQREILLQRGDLLSLPIQVFEMIHLNTYQNNIVQKYSKLNCLLELDSANANHLHREAFSNSEVAKARERLAQLQDFQAKLNSIWRCIRWLMDVITFARDRGTFGISVRYILDKDSSSPKNSLLQIPSSRDTKVKNTPGRGSWPGPGAVTTQSTSLINEFSKSEQQLSSNESASQYLSAYSDTESRKNSDSYASVDLNERLVPSKSEDMLFAVPSSSTAHRCRASTVSSVSATSSPLLNLRPMYSGSLLSVNTFNTTNTSDSMHSLSSDSDGTIPLGSSTPRRVKNNNKQIVPSRSMTNMKQHNLEARFRPKLDPYFNNNLESNLSKSLTNLKNVFDEKKIENKVPEQSSSSIKEQAGILQVYAAYETGLASGTSLKLHVTPRTTAREVVDLVVKQLNMAVVLKGKDGPIYTSDKLRNFCLVAVIGARERCLRDDFKPLQLQNPWKKGRLYVRQKQEVLAALEHSSKHTAII
nr:ankyrin repeat and fibronectin type-III domain-containing protein 1 isoform X2 [Onthophagus taurus]